MDPIEDMRPPEPDKSGFSRLIRFGRNASGLLAALRSLRLILFMLAIGFFALIQAPQGKDVLRGLVDDGKTGQSLWLSLALLLWSAQTYWAAVILLQRTDVTRFPLIWLPISRAGNPWFP